jgi:nucleoid-associated protein YgaU
LKTRLATAAPPADLDAMRARAADAERKAAAAQTAARNLTDENARLREALASVSQTIGRAVGVAPAPASSQPAMSRVEPPAVSRPDTPTRPSASPPASAATTTAAVVPPAITAPAVRTHTIAAGDTLAKISRQYYGTPDRWADILAANRDVLHDEKSLVIGRVLKIP